MTSPEITIAAPGRYALGECPVWHAGERALYFIDAPAPAVHRLGPDGAVMTWAMPRPIGSFALWRDGGLIAALKGGFAAVDLTTGAVTPIVDPEPERPQNLLNDGKCDRRGRFWCGSRDAALTRPTGALYRLDPNLTARRMDDGFIVGNGLAWSPDDRTLYFSDSRAETVFAYDFDLDDGTIRNRRVFFSTAGIAGRPDGATVDTEGFYWSALVHGGRLARIDPKGRVDRFVELPVKHPTMCAFGGEALDVLYVTSAAAMVPDAERATTPAAGAVFAIRGLGARGLPEPMFGG